MCIYIYIYMYVYIYIYIYIFPVLVRSGRAVAAVVPGVACGRLRGATELLCNLVKMSY